MPKLPGIIPKKLVKILKEIGFGLDHTSGSHFVFYHPKTKKRAVIPFHNKRFTQRHSNKYFKRSWN